MKIVAEGTIAASAPGTERASCCFPYVCVLPTGRWICGYREAATKTGLAQRSCVTWSDDQGKTWSPPIRPFAPLTVGKMHGIFRQVKFTSLGGRRVLASLFWCDCTDLTLPYFHPKTDGLLDTRGYFAISEDAGATWSPPRPVVRGQFNDIPTPTTGPILRLADGTWASQFETNKHYEDPAPWHHCSAFVFSSDEGKTWSKEAVVTAVDPTHRIMYWDQRPGVMPDGSVLVLFWTWDTQASRYLDITARRSTDNGRTWSPLWDTGVPGQAAPPVGLPDGRIVMVRVDRTSAPAIRARISSDAGRTWPAEHDLLVHTRTLSSQDNAKGSTTDALDEQGKFSVGLPHTAGLPDGQVLVVYYTGPQPDNTDVRWARIAP